MYGGKFGIKSMMHDLGRNKSGIWFADSTAALGIAKRKGAGKLRHINTNTLWIRGEEFRSQKVLSTRRSLV